MSNSGAINLTSALTVIEGDTGVKYYSLADGMFVGHSKTILRHDPNGYTNFNVITVASFGLEAAIVLAGVPASAPFDPAMWSGVWTGTDWLTTALTGNAYTSV